MAGKNTAAFGIYTNRSALEHAVDALKTAGYRNTDISVSTRRLVVRVQARRLSR
jgi:hypothetical protein